MAGAHIAHNCVVGSQVIMANGATLGGHVTVQDRAFISGLPGASILPDWHAGHHAGRLGHQQGPAAVHRGAGRQWHLRLERGGPAARGLSAADRLELKKLYQALFRGGKLFSESLAAAREKFSSPAAQCLLDFIAASKRGFVPPAARPLAKNLNRI